MRNLTLIDVFLTGLAQVNTSREVKMPPFSLHKTAFWLILATLVASICLAQVGTGRLDGGVVDATGGTMAGAKVTAIHQATQSKTETITNTDGNFVFPSLQAGLYTISV